MDKATCWIGKRVEIPPHADLWMRGDRYGTVEAAGIVAGRVLVRVLMDKSHRYCRAWADNCKEIV